MARSFRYGRYLTSTGPNATPALSWTTTITAASLAGDIWYAELMGFKVQYITGASPTTTTIAAGLAAAIDALPGITSTNVANVITTTRTAAPTQEYDQVSHLVVWVEGVGAAGGLTGTFNGSATGDFGAFGPYRRQSNGAWTNVVATSGTGFAEFAVWRSEPVAGV